MADGTLLLVIRRMVQHRRSHGLVERWNSEVSDDLGFVIKYDDSRCADMSFDFPLKAHFTSAT